MCKETWVQRKHCCQQNAFLQPMLPLKVQMRSNTRIFAQWNLILAHLQHSKFDIIYPSHSPLETFHWLCVYMVVKLHAHWNKHSLNVKVSYRVTRCWWLTSRTCVNILINEKKRLIWGNSSLSIWDIAIHLEEPHKLCQRPAVRAPLV